MQVKGAICFLSGKLSMSYFLTVPSLLTNSTRFLGSYLMTMVLYRTQHITRLSSAVMGTRGVRLREVNTLSTASGSPTLTGCFLPELLTG